MASETKSNSTKLWGGRFTGKTDPVFESFNASISFDKSLWLADIKGSQAYAKALGKAGVLHTDEVQALVDGLDQVASEWAKGSFEIRPDDEDIHSANERRLGELVGDVAGKLHTGRSRNDQAATDLRLWLTGEIDGLRTAIRELIGAALTVAERDIEMLMPGYTHLQPAQPIRWSHFILSYAFAWKRDAARLDELLARVKVCPLGSGALAGNPFNVERHYLAEQLGFTTITDNSLDAVCDRDYVAEFCFWASLTMVHISQWAEDLIILNSRKFVHMADAYSTGSSLMPQKKNPDACELLRGKCGRVTGSLVSILTTLKALPRAYNKDLQEDKEGLFDTVATLRSALPIAAGVLSTLTPNAEAMRGALLPEMLATDLAEFLVRAGVPFRTTHHIAGRAVKLAEDQKKPLSSLTREELKSLHPAFDTDAIAQIWDFDAAVERRNSIGSASLASVRTQIATLKSWLNQSHSV